MLTGKSFSLRKYGFWVCKGNQNRRHPAPFFATPAPKPAVADVPKPAEPVARSPAEPVAPPRTVPITRAPLPVAVRRNDPIADLIGPPARVSAVQRVLSEYGYGQLKPIGVYDVETKAAVQRFEREHDLSVTDEISEPTKRALADLTGRALD